MRTTAARALLFPAIAAALAIGLSSPAQAIHKYDTDTSTSSAIRISQRPFEVILPNARVGKFAAASDNVTAFHGFSRLKSVKIQSQGFDIKGTIRGKVKSHSFERLYEVYNLPSSDSWRVWVAHFKRDQNRTELKETFSNEELIDLDVNIEFSVKADALRGVSTLRIGFETLRLNVNGKTKDFTVINEASGSAKDQNGNDIPVEFKPV